MKVTTYETLYEEHGATLKHNIWESLYHGATFKHKCGKRIVALPLLFYFYFLGLFLGQCSIEWWSSHFYLFTTQWLQLDTRTKYDSIWMPLAVYRDCDESRVTCMKNHERWLCHKYNVNYMIMQSNMTMMKRVIINRTVESCMAIYLAMAMEMP